MIDNTGSNAPTVNITTSEPVEDIVEENNLEHQDEELPLEVLEKPIMARWKTKLSMKRP